MRPTLLLLAALPLACAPTPLPPLSATPSAPASPSPPALPPSQRFADPPLPPVSFVDPQRRAKIAAAYPELEKLFAAAHDKAKLEGLVVGLVVDGELVWSKGWGYRDVAARAPADVDTVFRIGSMTKTFTTTAMLALRDQGKLALDDRADRYIPELGGVVYARRDAPPITLRNLATHSSGLPQFGPFDFCDPKHELTEEEIVRTLPGASLGFTTNTVSDYSTEGMGLAGNIVGRVSGVGYRAFVSRALLAPLGMTESAWNEEDVSREHFAKGYVRKEDGSLENPPNFRVGATSGAGAMYSSVRDLAKWVAFHLSAWPPRDDADTGPVRRDSLREMTRPAYAGRVRAMPAPRSSPWQVDAGLGWQGLGWGAKSSCDFDLALEHGGGEEDRYTGYIEFLPTQGIGVVALWNLATLEPFETQDEAFRIVLRAAGRQSRASEPNQGLLEAQRRANELLAHWDDTKAHALLDGLFHDAISDATTRAEWEETPRKYGPCQPDGKLEADNQLVGRWNLACERGRLSVEVDLVSVNPLRIRHYRIDERHVPGDRVTRVADGIVGLSAKWREDDASKLVGAKGALAELRAALVASGPCKMDEALEGGDEHRGSFRLTCQRGARKLDVKLGAAGERAESVAMEPALAPGERCLRK
jgi:CubicO group peptidase (beta-lactamase class C family)